MLSDKVKVSIFGLVTTSQVFVPFAHAVHDGVSNDGVMINAAGELLIHGMNDFSESFGLQWVTGEFNSTDSAAEFNITTFSVLKEKPDALYFSQNGLSKTEDSSTLNIGAGVYKLLDGSGLMPSFFADSNVIVGANVFLDAKSGTSSLFNIFGSGVHKRYSVGGTLKTSGIDINANLYRAISNEVDGYNIINGWDYGIDGTLPGLDQVKLGASVYNFTGTKEAFKGRKFNIEYKPNSMFTFGTAYDDARGSNSDTQSIYAKITYTFDVSMEEQLKFKSLKSSNVWDKRYDEVKRENTIFMEKIASTPEIIMNDNASTISINGNGKADMVIKLSQAIAEEEVVTIKAVSSQPEYIRFLNSSGDNVMLANASETEYADSSSEITLSFTDENWENGITLNLESFNALRDDVPEQATIKLVVASSHAGNDFENMLEKEITVNIIPAFGQSDANVKLDQPSTVSWGTDVQLSGVTGGGTGAITYAVKDDPDSIGVTVDGSGLVSGATKAGLVVITVSRAGDDKYIASDINVILVFEKSDAAITVATPTPVMWGADIQIPTAIGGGTGVITYVVKDDSDSIGATVDVSTGLVSGATKAGAIIVTVSRAGDDNYEASSVDVIVTFDKSDADVTVATPTAVLWGNNVQIPTAIGGGTGAISYAVKTDADSVGATVDGSGLVSGATKAGAIVVTVTRAGDDNYEASSVDVIVTFDKSDAAVTVATPTSVMWGTDIQIPTAIGGGTGAITYTVTDSDLTGATVDNAGLVSGATKAGAIVVTVSRAADANYEASSADVIVTFSKSDSDVTVATPTSVMWGTDIQIPAAIGGGTGAITYVVKDDADSIGATVDGSGLVSGATKAGSVVITISRAADANYEASSIDLTVTFDKVDAAVTVATPATVTWGTDIQIPAAIGGGTGAITYTVKTDADSIGATVDGSGLVSGAAKAGSVVITVSRAADDNYEASSVDVIVTFDKSDAAVTVATPTSVMWGTDIQIPTAIGGGTGAITYTVTDSDLTGATVDNAGLVSGATKVGSVTITVNRAADANYNASSVDVIVSFDKSDADITVVTPASVAWDTNAQIAGVSGGGTGAITYVVKTDADSIGATVDGSGLVSGATKAGSVVITVSRAGDDNYEASSVDVIVAFDKSDADVTVATPTAVSWGNNVQIPTAIGGGTGAISYTVKTDADSIGATVDVSTGLVSGATEAGSVVITVSRAGDDNYEASSVDVIVTFNKSDSDVTVTTPGSVSWGTDVQISDVIGGGTGAITYAVKDDSDSIGATVDGSGLVSGATKAGAIIVTVSRAGDDNYEASSVDVIVAFNKSDAAVTVVTPGSVVWGNDVQISEVIGGGTGAISYAVKTDVDSVGATVDNAGLVSGATKAGSVVITVSRAADANYEASSVDVIVAFDKSDADVTVATPTAVSWGNNVQISGVIGGGTGAITYVVKDDSDSIGATVDVSTGLVSGATKAGSVVITVSRAADANYNASSADVIVTFDKSDADVTVATPAAVIWGTDIQIPAAIGGGTGAITYIVKTDVDSVGATVDNAGLVSGATKAGSVVITVSRAADANYEASSVDVTVAFDKSDIGFIVAQPGSVSWGTDVQISGVIGGGTGAITYVVKTDSDSIGATVDVSTGLVSGATKAGAIVVTVSRAADANYNAFSADVIVTFDKSDAAVTVATPTSVMWGTDIQIPTAIGGGTGAITYTVTDSDLTGATVDNAGLVSGATKAGSVVITVSRAADANYEASSADVIVTFNKSDSDVTVATPTSVMWGTDIQIPAAIGGGTGAITYVVKDDVDSIGATVDVSTGLVSGATKAGSVVITVSRAADANYEASSADVIVTFSKSDSDVTVATPTSVMWGTDIQIPAAIGGGTGAITYVVKDDADSIGATVDGSGLVSGATKAGSVVITISRAADANYEASSIDLTVTFDKVDAAVTVATPATVTWGTDIQIPAAIGGGTGAITYTVKTDADSIGATVDGSGLVSGAAKAGSVVITVSRAADDNYEASSVDVIVTFDKSDAAVTVATPTSVMWGTDIQIPTAIGGGTGAITYTVTDSDLTGATVDNAGLVSGATKVGSVTITVNRAADANYNASSVDVIVSFDKSDADITVVTPASVAWDTNAQIAGVSGGGTGAITYVVKTDADSIGATVDGSGLVSGATKAGSVVITISRAGDDNYEASSVDVTVVFDKSDADVTVATPTSVMWGTDIQIPTAIGGGTGAISYAVKTDADSIGATVDVSTGLVSGATEAGSVVITVSRAGDDNYEASSVDVIVTFNKSDSDVTVTTPGSVSWGTDVQISDVIGGGTGAITYAVKDDSDSIGATVDGSGLVSGATKAGAIIVTVSRAGDDNYEASSVDVIVAFNKSDAAVTVVTPGSVVWGNDVQISEVIGGGTGAISYAVKTDVDSVGATVDNAGLVSGATKAGSVVITVSRAADANYEASSVDVIVAFDKSDADVTVATPTAVSWGNNVQISGVIGGGTGAITYVVKDDSDSIGATVDVSTGLVSGATKAGSVVITVSRAADANYNASSADVIVTFDKSDADVTVATPAAVIWGTDIQIPAAIGGGTGAITYIVKTDVDSVGATVDNAGLVSGATKAGSVVITVSRAADANYEASSVDVTVAFDKSDIGFIVAQPGSVSWGTDVQISGVIGGGTGAITYVVKTDSDSIGATVDVSTGLVSGATKAGAIVVTVSRAADANYNAFSADVIVTFDKSDAAVTVATPTSVMWGTDIQIPTAIGGGTGAITYTVTDSDLTGATVDNAGLVSGATKAGSVVITVSRAADANYEASSADVIVTFSKSDSDVTVATPTSVMWGTDIQIPAAIGGGTGAITYVVKDDVDSIGATVDVSTGLVSGATKAGSVVITVSRAADANYEASSADVIVTFSKSDSDVTVATPTSVMWGTDIQIPAAIGGGTGAITYVVKDDADSIGATVDGSGLVSGATKAGSVVITISRAADANYEASSIDLTVTFDKVDAAVTVATPATVTWGTDIQIPAAIGGGTGAITYTVKTDADSIGATVDGSGLVSGAAKAGSVVITVSRAADDNYEASSVDVIVTFDKSDAAVTVATPTSVMWGTDIQIPTAIGGGTGAITYTVTDSDLTGATVDNAGLVSGATKVGSVTITVNRAADANYNASSVDVIVSFDKSDADITVVTPASVAWDTNAQIAGVSGGGTGAITYVVKTDADSIGATVDGSGLVSGATKAGSVVITISRAGDDNYEASSVDVIVVFDKSDADVTVATPTAVSCGQ